MILRSLQLLAIVLASQTLFAAPPHASIPSATVPEGLGVNIHFTDARPGELEMLAAADFRWVRMDLTWAVTERQRGQYDFSRCRTIRDMELANLFCWLVDYAQDQSCVS